MKFTTILWVIFCLHGSARCHEQTLSFSGKHVPLAPMVSSIEKQAGLALEGQGLSYRPICETTFVIKKGLNPAINLIVGAIRGANGLENVTGTEINQQGNAFAEPAISVTDRKKVILASKKGFLFNNVLDKTQVMAYGNTTLCLNIGDLPTVKGMDIHKQPVDEPLAALEGQDKTSEPRTQMRHETSKNDGIAGPPAVNFDIRVKVICFKILSI